jgi:hypothetical protein
MNPNVLGKLVNPFSYAKHKLVITQDITSLLKKTHQYLEYSHNFFQILTLASKLFPAGSHWQALVLTLSFFCKFFILGGH